MSTGIFTLVFGVVFVIVGLRFAAGERRAAARSRRRLRRGYVVACLLVVVLGVAALLLAVPILVQAFSTPSSGF